MGEDDHGSTAAIALSPSLCSLAGAAVPVVLRQHPRLDVGPVGLWSLVLGTAAAYWLVREIIGDRARGRSRCRRCWYDMPAEVPAICPECGTEASKPAQLYRTRRRVVRVALALLVVLAAQIGWCDGSLRRSGVVGIVPTPVLAHASWFVPDDWLFRTLYASPDRSLMARVRAGELSTEELNAARKGVLARIGSGMDMQRLALHFNMVRTLDRRSREFRDPNAPSGSRPEIGPPTPELAQAAVRAIDRAITALAGGDLEASRPAAAWIRTEFEQAAFQRDVEGIFSQPVLDLLRAREAELRALASVQTDERGSMAYLLLAFAGLAGVDDVPALKTLAGSLDEAAASPALAGLWCLGIEHEEAFDAWREVLLVPDPRAAPALPMGGRRPMPARRVQSHRSERLAQGALLGRVVLEPEVAAHLAESDLLLVAGDDTWRLLAPIEQAQRAMVAAGVQEFLASPMRGFDRLSSAGAEARARHVDLMLPLLAPDAGPHAHGFALSYLRHFAGSERSWMPWSRRLRSPEEHVRRHAREQVPRRQDRRGRSQLMESIRAKRPQQPPEESMDP
ncbi:MAG: hypothetical protein R3B68_13940 [Phycisphaerales bacterium]